MRNLLEKFALWIIRRKRMCIVTVHFEHGQPHSAVVWDKLYSYTQAILDTHNGKKSSNRVERIMVKTIPFPRKVLAGSNEPVQIAYYDPSRPEKELWPGLFPRYANHASISVV